MAALLLESVAAGMDRDLDGIGRFLEAAAGLDDTELAVAVQGLLTRRPRARTVLLNVWRAEDAVGMAGPRTPVALPATVPQAWAAPEAKAGGPGEGKVDMTTRHGFLAEARGYAARGGVREVGTEHVLATAVFALPADSRRALGGALHDQLAELLEKSCLAKAPAGAPAGSENIPCESDVEPLLTALGRGPAALLDALQQLPDDAAATQLLEMAKIFVDRQRPQPEEEERGAPETARPDSEQQAALRARAASYAAGSGARAIGTEHILAAALAAFPEDAERAMGGKLLRQLEELLEKSQLGPPPAAGAGAVAGMPVSDDAKPLLGTVAEHGEQTALFRAMEALPDSAAAIQLLEMAKIFAERA